MPAKSKAQQRLMAAEDAAYIAGFFDGEGCLTMRRSNRHARGKEGSGVASVHYRLALDFANRHIGVLKWIQQFTGGAIYSKYGPKRKATWAPAFALVLWNKADIERLLRAIQPYVKVKTEQVALGLDFLSLPAVRIAFERRGKTWPRRVSLQEDLDLREDFKARLSVFNLRGKRAS
jgi:hypothetical protein